MRERWIIQLSQGINIAFIYIFIQIFWSIFEAKEDSFSVIIAHPLFYLNILVSFIIGLFVVGYFSWKFPKKKAAIKQYPKDIGRDIKVTAELKNYIINNIVFMGAFFIVMEFKKLSTAFSPNKVLWFLPLVLIGGGIYGYFDWRANSIKKQ